MRKLIHVLTLMLALGAAFPSVATTMTGVAVPLAPVAAYTLPSRSDRILNFTSFDIGAGFTVRFDTRQPYVTLRSVGDILIAGAIDTIGTTLALETPGRIVLTGTILADSMLLSGNLGVIAGTSGGDLCLRDCGRLISSSGRLSLSSGTLQLLPGGDITLHASGISPGILPTRQGGDITLLASGARVFAVPEPATPWLVALLLPMLALFGRKRT